MTSSEGSGRRLDVVVFGATGFVGRLVAEHLAGHAPAGVRIGIAGRSPERLAQLQADLGAPAAGWQRLVADSGDPASLAALARSTRVVATTVGPYARYGLPLVEACAWAGTDCVDLTGELLFARECVDRFHDVAVASRARIVNAGGFDAVPSDLGVLLAHQRAQADDAGLLEQTTLVLVSMRGGFSGGTLDSLRNQVDAVRADPGLRKVLADPYALSPDRAAEPNLGDERDQTGVAHDELVGAWTAPFVMAPFNTRIVRRSNALQGWAYGRRFRYREVMGVGRSPFAPALAAVATAGLAGVAAGMALPPARAVLDRILPAPGEGPSEQTRRNGHFRMQVHTRTSGGAHYVATVAAKGDPGYAATAVMLGEGALCLALDRDRLPRAAGVLTPATAMGGALVDRLRARGFQLDVERR